MSDLLGLDFKAHFQPELDSLGDLAADGLVEQTESSLTVTDAGRLFIRNIAMRFDPYNAGGKEGRFSKTI
jgi:oxygen-independent coproporphyrinogen-3 oxidase